MYGANRSLLGLICELRRLGVVPMVVVPRRGPFSDALEHEGVAWKALPSEWWMASGGGRLRALKRLLQNLCLLPVGRALARTFGADLIYSNTACAPLGFLVAEFSRIPHVWHLREFCDLDYNLRPDWGWPLLRWSFGRARARIAISHAIRAHLMGEAADVVVIYNGVTTRSQLQKNWEGRAVAPHAGYEFALLGLIRPSKGQATAIDALALATTVRDDLRLRLVGAGDKAYIEQLRLRTELLGLADRVSFCGHLRDVEEVYRHCDAVLMCSPNEAMGRVTIEAMSYARPVIGYDGGGTREIIRHGETGLLYDGTPASLAERMVTLAEHPSLGRALGEAGWRECVERFTVEQSASEVWQVTFNAVGGV